MSAETPTVIHFGREIDYLEDLGAKLRNLQGFTTLAHELLQNADDVPGVTVFTFDVRDDALIVENDGVFSDCGQVEQPECPWKEVPNNGSHRCDFHRFRLVAGADKRNEAGTTGAFGIGFISVYQITDRPELISKRHWILDESQPAGQRIAQCPGCSTCRTSNPGTRFYPDEEPGRIAPGLKEVLAAETAAEAKDILDELGFSTLESPPTAPAGDAKPVGELGGQTTAPDSPPLTPDKAVDAILGPGVPAPTAPPVELNKTDKPEGQPAGGMPFADNSYSMTDLFIISLIPASMMGRRTSNSPERFGVGGWMLGGPASTSPECTSR
jgi:hypothetical protein